MDDAALPMWRLVLYASAFSLAVGCLALAGMKVVDWWKHRK